MNTLGHFINGEHGAGSSSRRHGPTTGKVQAQSILASTEDVKRAIDASAKAFSADDLQGSEFVIPTMK